MNALIKDHLKDLHKLDPRANDWARRHLAAWDNQGTGIEMTIRFMVTSWADYADLHKERYDSPIGLDYVIGVAWAKQGAALLELLNGETGRYDCGTLDRLIRAIATANEIDLEKF